MIVIYKLQMSMISPEHFYFQLECRHQPDRSETATPTYKTYFKIIINLYIYIYNTLLLSEDGLIAKAMEGGVSIEVYNYKQGY